MRGMSSIHVVLGLALIISVSPCFSTEVDAPKEVQESKYLRAVREFADNVLKYGKDTYGSKHTPLFVDGLNVHNHEPVKWIAPNGDKWILSNLASQQNLFRTLDGLTKITGDPKYRQAAMEAIEYAFENLRSPNGLLYWGAGFTYDANGDRTCSDVRNHSLRWHYPYYELMWEVVPDETKDYVESFWASHILNWSNLDMNRYGPMDSYMVAKGWNHEYKGGPVFFVSRSFPHHSTGSDLIYAAAWLTKLSREKEPLVWAKRLAHRYVETRGPNTGIAGTQYTITKDEAAKYQFGDDFKGRNISGGTLFPFQPGHFAKPGIKPVAWAFQIRGWICAFLVGDLLGSDGKEFEGWALEELTAWGKSAYRKEDNSLIPMLTDGTSLDGYVLKKDGAYGTRGTVFKAWHPQALEFWAYALAYRITKDQFMWEMSQNIARGNSFGNIGNVADDELKVDTKTNCSDPYALFGFLELYRKTKRGEFLDMASKIGNNILTYRFYKGFFLPSKNHVYARFDSFEHLALLHLFATIESKSAYVPWVWPSESCFACDYRQRKDAFDVDLIYVLTDSLEPPISLHEAAAVGDLEQIKSLLSEVTEIDGRERAMWSPLHRATLNGHKQAVELLLAEGADIEARNSFGNSALYYAADRDHKDVAELLIVKGADVNATNSAGDTPLHYAARGGHEDIIELLIAKGTDVNAKNNDGQTPIDVAAGANRRDTVELLIAKGAEISNIYLAVYLGDVAKMRDFVEKGADVNATNSAGDTPLHYAAKSKDAGMDTIELAEFLIAKGADVNAKEKWGYTPLYYAIWNENKDMVRLLVDKGADVNFLPKNDGTPLEYAVWNEDKDMAEFFVAHGARFDTKDNDGWTAFRYAAAQGSRDLVEFFVDKGADVSSFHGAACVGDLDRVKHFVRQGTDIDTKDELNWTPLHWAASTSQEGAAEFLIAKGADVNAKKQDERTPLHQAAVAGGIKLSKLLISKGADVNARDKYGTTPLHRAASSGHPELTKLLVANGADVDPKNRSGQTPLFSAALRGYKDVVEILVAKGADIDAKARSDRTALHFAVLMNRKDMAELLIDSGADVNAKNTDAQTPLHLAARQGRKEVAELLIAKGADLNAKNKWGWTPLDLAVERGHTEIVELLRKHETKE